MTLFTGKYWTLIEREQPLAIKIQGLTAIFFPPLLSANGGQTIKLFAALPTYEKALQEDLPRDIRAMVEMQHNGVIANRVRARLLQGQMQ